MSGLSSRVKNMKFMQRGDPVAETAVEEPVQKVFLLQSEWSLPQAAAMVAKSKQKPVVETVGFGSINAFEDPENIETQGKKVYGANKSVPEIDIGCIRDSIATDADKDNSISNNEAKKNKKRKATSSGKSTKKKSKKA